MTGRTRPRAERDGRVPVVKSPYHEGEQAVQRRAREGHPGWGSPMFDGVIPAGFVPFLLRQRMLVVGAVDRDGAVWASALTGPAGFAEPVGPSTLAVAAAPAPADPLHGVFAQRHDIGVLALEPQTVRRIRVNGTARQQDDGLVVRTEQVLGNCPKYLQRRLPVADAPPRTPRVVASGTGLGADQRRLVEEADTFFIASHAPGHGADASHRGGQPGFVTAAGPRRLVWPDYVGNSFYMTLGNLQLDPACGLLFWDWDRGSFLHLTGRARVDWDEHHRAGVPGALRMVEFDVERFVQVDDATALRWEFAAASPVNPPAPLRS
ncbi:pyridoxamine 5'-phosphate oxidase family protein [Streptomyces sp. NPDC018955]|uniref:pyridoxamine 5'-phosphate oxidase family protein n=1 Tax=Streptomyces sp. NPDC018955 TaxID=3365055 RepID=UPI00378F7961